MKKLFTIAFAMMLGASLSFAQASGASTDKAAPAPASKTASSTSTKSGKKSHKTAAKKKGSKKGSEGATTTPAPK